MKKITCAKCGMVNLDRFVSFPNCAACGRLLSQKSEPRWRELGNRKVSTLTWACVLGSGVAVVALLIIGTMRETRSRDAQTMFIASHFPQSVVRNQVFPVSFRIVNGTEESPDTVRYLRIRLPRETEKNFHFVSISGIPQTNKQIGSGHYFSWDKFDTNRSITLRLRPVTTGKKTLRIDLLGLNYKSTQIVRSIKILANSQSQ